MRMSKGPTGGCDIAESLISEGVFPFVHQGRRTAMVSIGLESESVSMVSVPH